MYPSLTHVSRRSKEPSEGLAQHSLAVGFWKAFCMCFPDDLGHHPPPTCTLHSGSLFNRNSIMSDSLRNFTFFNRNSKDTLGAPASHALYHSDSPLNHGDRIHFKVSCLSQPGRMESTRREQCISGTTKPNYLLHQTCRSKLKLLLLKNPSFTFRLTLFHTEVTNFESFKSGL